MVNNKESEQTRGCSASARRTHADRENLSFLNPRSNRESLFPTWSEIICLRLLGVPQHVGKGESLMPQYKSQVLHSLLVDHLSM